jgi:hypothetical protein
MKRINFLLGLTIFFLLFLTPSKANILNLTGSTSSTITSNQGINYWVWHIDSYWDVSRQEWYYLYGLATSGGVETPYLCRYNSDFTTIMDGCDSQLASGTGTYQRGTDFYSYNSTHLFELTDREDSPYYHPMYYVSKTDLSRIQYSASTGFEVGDMDIRLGQGYKNDSYVYTQGTVGTTYFCFSNGTCNQLFINAIHNRPTDLNFIYIPDTDEYYLFYANKSSSGCGNAYLNIYDASTDDDGLTGWQPDFKGWFQISTGCLIANEPTGATHYTGTFPKSQGFLYAKYINGFVYWIARQRESVDNNNTLYFEAIDPVGTKNHHWLNIIKNGGEKVNLTAYDSNLCEPTTVSCNTTIQAPSFEYQTDKAQWWIFYHTYNYTNLPSSSSLNQGYQLKVLKTSSQCLCGEWYNASGCGDYIPNQKKQLRSCNPDVCDIEERYIDCVQQPISVATKKESSCEICSTGAKKPQNTPQAKCSVSVNIPENAINIISNATWSMGVSIPFSFSSEDMPAFYRIILCNPITNCFDQKFFCSQINVTEVKYYGNYQAGEIATAEFGIAQASSCKLVRKFLVDIGWSDYTVNGQLCVYYDMPCGGWVCTSSGLNDYLQYENPDCSREPLNETDICQFGCENGKCLSESEAKEGQSDLEQIAKDIGSPVGQIFGFALSGMDSMFPSPDLKILGAFIITISVVLGISLITKKEKGIVIGLVAGLFMLFFFMIRNYIPLWIGVLVAIPEIGFIILLIMPSSKVK